jgi:hypothetical protein
MSEKNAEKFCEKYNLPIVCILVRGGTGHRKDLCLIDGSIIYLYKDGSMVKSSIKWNLDNGDKKRIVELKERFPNWIFPDNIEEDTYEFRVVKENDKKLDSYRKKMIKRIKKNSREKRKL